MLKENTSDGHFSLTGERYKYFTEEKYLIKKKNSARLSIKNLNSLKRLLKEKLIYGSSQSVMKIWSQVLNQRKMQMNKFRQYEA